MVNQFENIRDVVEAMAELICCEGISPSSDGHIRQRLLERGFDLDSIRAAEDWCDMAANSGSIIDLLSVFVPTGSGPRISNPLEEVSCPAELWSMVQKLRSRGIISPDLAERIVEGARAMDARDWEDEDIRAFFAETCVMNGALQDVERVEKVLKGDFSDFYS